MTTITKAHKRSHVRVTISDDLILESEIGTTAEEFLKATEEFYPFEAPLMGAIVDGKLRELNYPINHDVSLAPISLNTSDGARIYRRTLVLIMVTAAYELWPDSQISVRYAVPDGGYYCKRLDKPAFTRDELQQLENRMREIIANDEPIAKREATVEEIRQLFTQREEWDKVRLLDNRERPIALYTLRGYADTTYGFVLPSTGGIGLFKLLWTENGFILQFPLKESPTILEDLNTYPKLRRVFEQTDRWILRTGVDDIGRLNQIIREDKRLSEIILVAEALHERNVAQIAGEIQRRFHEQNTRLVLIAGPTSSGKTTFSKRLAIQLLAGGLRPFTLELDNYFIDRDRTPLDENGDYDFEALEAINLELFNEHLEALFRGQEVLMPRYDFITGKSVPNRTVKLDKNQILIVEGIHGLNPKLLPNMTHDRIHRIYISALAQLNIDLHNRVPTTDVRLLRRMVRDARTRGYSATQTIERWASVGRGERRNIFPYQENADSIFNSGMIYELAALKPFAAPLLHQVEENTLAHIEAKRLLSFLSWVRPLANHQLQLIPNTSLLREFIGDSILDDYHPFTAGDHIDS
jgi:uridine kinase